MQKIKCRVLPLHCGRCGLHLCLIRHPCALHLPSAFETRSRTSSRTRKLSFHGTPSFQLLIRAEAQCRAAFADCCRPAQHLASSLPRGGWLRHALVAVFIERHHRDYLSLIICLITPYITFLFLQPWEWHSALTQQEAAFSFDFVFFLHLTLSYCGAQSFLLCNSTWKQAVTPGGRPAAKGKKKKSSVISWPASVCVFLRWWVRSWIPSIPCLSPSSSWAGVCRAPEAVKSWCVNCFYTSHLIFSLWSFHLRWGSADNFVLTASPKVICAAHPMHCSILFLLILLCGRAEKHNSSP